MRSAPSPTPSHRLSLAALAAVALAFGAPTQSPAAVVPELLTPVANAKDPQMGKFPLLRNGTRVAVNFALLDKGKVGDRIRVRFDRDRSYIARLEQREVAPTLKNGFHWHGTLEGKQSSQFIITVDDTGIASWFSTMDDFVHTFTVEGSRRETYARIYDDAANHAKSATPPYVDKAIQTFVNNGGILNSNNAGCSDDPNRINLAVYYTTGANAQAIGTCATRISNGIAQANTCLKNSGLTLRLYLTRNVQVTSVAVELSSMSACLTALASKTDKNWDVVHTDRRKGDADLVELIVADVSGHGNTTGIAYRPSVWGHFHPGSGFGVTEWNAIAGYTMIHEIGHNLACGHDKANASGTHLYSYAYGFNKKFCERGFPIYNRNYLYTVMSYRPSMSCSGLWKCIAQRVPSFSGTNIRFNFGSPCGTHTVGSSTARNNVVIGNTRSRVANYSRMINGTHLARNIVVRSINPSSGITVTTSRRDSNGKVSIRTNGTLVYCGTTTTTLTAPAFYGHAPFKRWILNGVKQATHRRTLSLSTSRHNIVDAEYYTHIHGSFTMFGKGCVGSGNRTPILRGLGHPDIGQRVTMQTYNARPGALGRLYAGLSKTRWGGIPLPLDLSVIGMTGCYMNVSPDWIFGIRFDSRGYHNMTLTVQNIPSTIGVHVYWQSGVFDSGAPRYLKAAHSNGLDLKIGGNK